jgi:hypothetical protein
MGIGKGRVQQICEEIFRLSISFHDVPTLSPFPYLLFSFPSKRTKVMEGTQDKRVSSSLPHPHKQPVSSRNPILLQRNENYPTSIIYIPDRFFSFLFWGTLSCDMEEILVLLVTVEFSPLGVLLLPGYTWWNCEVGNWSASFNWSLFHVHFCCCSWKQVRCCESIGGPHHSTDFLYSTTINR